MLNTQTLNQIFTKQENDRKCYPSLKSSPVSFYPTNLPNSTSKSLENPILRNNRDIFHFLPRRKYTAGWLEEEEEEISQRSAIFLKKMHFFVIFFKLKGIFKMRYCMHIYCIWSFTAFSSRQPLFWRPFCFSRWPI